jgi:hypothetical protein
VPGSVAYPTSAVSCFLVSVEAAVGPDPSLKDSNETSEDSHLLPNGNGAKTVDDDIMRVVKLREILVTSCPERSGTAG